jgi:hypothetical protein
MSFSTDGSDLYQNLDAAHPDKYLLVGAPGSDGVATCYVHVADGPLQGRVFKAIGRTVLYHVDVIHSTSRFVKVQRPFVIRRDDGHEIAYG